MEFLLLDKLFAAKGRVLTREALLSAVWDADASGNQRTVDTHIKTLRAKLKDADADFDPITTLRGVGYGYRE